MDHERLVVCCVEHSQGLLRDWCARHKAVRRERVRRGHIESGLFRFRQGNGDALRKQWNELAFPSQARDAELVLRKTENEIGLDEHR